MASAPIDPLTPEETRSVNLKSRVNRVAARRRQHAATHEVHPAGMSLDRAMQIAAAALGNENG